MAAHKNKHHDKHDAAHAKSGAHEAKHSEKSKNVSHVPCKFFRQSICQAGDKCPFSHELDDAAPAVCKYFQKGNCKFGSKCALAHITPDGRHVNKRTKDTKKKDGKEEPSHAPPHAQPHTQPILIGKSQKTGSSSSQASDVTAVDPSSVEMASQILSKYNGGSPLVSSAHFQHMFSGSRRISQPESVYEPPPEPMMMDGSAILDDEEDDGTLYGGEDDEDGFREQLVPSTLEDLLTPTERERRKSLTSQRKSGRVFSSPSAGKAAPVFSFRRGSAPIPGTIYSQEPIGGTASAPSPTQGPSASASSLQSAHSLPSHSLQPSALPQSSSIPQAGPLQSTPGALWGPRNLDTPFGNTPFSRGLGFGSPPQTPQSMDSGALFNASLSQTPLKYQVAKPQMQSPTYLDGLYRPLQYTAIEKT